MDKVKVSIVSYLNTTPLVYGLENYPPLKERIELHKDIPSESAKKVQDLVVDLGLIPVAAIPHVPNATIVSDYCIGAEGKVKSVLLLSDVPLKEIKTIYLDYHSRTSVNLCKVLCREHWKISPEFKAASPGFEKNVKGTTAGVIIGDRTFDLPKTFEHQFDLSEEWEKAFGLPFVFAAWVSNKRLSEEFIQVFNEALEFGVRHLETSISAKNNPFLSSQGLHEYLTKYIKFNLNDEKRRAMNLFLSKLN